MGTQGTWGIFHRDRDLLRASKIRGQEHKYYLRGYFAGAGKAGGQGRLRQNTVKRGQIGLVRGGNNEKDKGAG